MIRRSADSAVGYVDRHRSVWERKPFLRRVYAHQFHSRLEAALLPAGRTLEVASGPGFFKQHRPDILATDLVRAGGPDTVADACRLPFKAESFANVVGLDAFHHFAAPLTALREAERVLTPGGRLILLEPWLTPFSRFVYRFFHQEDCDPGVDPHAPWQGGKSPMEGNQALPYLAFADRGAGRVADQVSGLRLLGLEPFAGWCYLGSLGFKPANLLPARLFPALSWCEEKTLPLWRNWLSLKALIVMMKESKEEVDGRTPAT